LVLSAAGRADDAFGSGRPFSIGVEEELFLVDPVTGRQTNSSAAVCERLKDTGTVRRGRIEPELHACQVELISGPCANAAQAVGQLRELRRAVVATGAGRLGSGTHPSAAEGDAEITDRARYEHIHDLLGDAVATPVAGLHVHVGMPDAETAIRVFNGLRRHLPLLQSLAANSPFRHGRSTGLASAREVTLRSWPRSGVPRAMRDYEDFCNSAARLARAADVLDYTWFWWKLRPHPRLGTVEIRALDVQSTPEDTEALVALIHGLCRAAAESDDDPGPAPDLIEEGLFRAARYGVVAHLPDDDGRLRPAHEVLIEALELARPYAAQLDATGSLQRLPGLIRESGGAGRQRAFFAIGGMDSLLRELTRVSSG
jgi:carboxylate-amine ligase